MVTPNKRRLFYGGVFSSCQFGAICLLLGTENSEHHLSNCAPSNLSGWCATTLKSTSVMLGLRLKQSSLTNQPPFHLVVGAPYRLLQGVVYAQEELHSSMTMRIYVPSYRRFVYLLFSSYVRHISSTWIILTCINHITIGEMYSIQHYVIKFVNHLRQVGGFLWVLRFPPPIKLTVTI